MKAGGTLTFVSMAARMSIFAIAAPATPMQIP